MTTLTVRPATVPMGGPLTPTLRVVRSIDAAPETGSRTPVRRAMVARPAACDRSYPADLHGSRLTARGRVVVALAWLLLAVLAAAPILGSPGEPARPLRTTTVVVQPGDTLWAFARSIDGTADPRVVVDAIVDLNGLRSGGDIHPGDVLVVPVAG